MIFKYLHILTMFAAVTLMFGGELMFHLLRRRNDLAALRRFLEVVYPVFRIGVGLLTGRRRLRYPGCQHDRVLPHRGLGLLLAYLLIAGIYAIGFLVGVPYFNRVRAALDDASLQAPSPELRRVLDDPRWILDLVVSVFLYVAIIFVMVMKPIP